MTFENWVTVGCLALCYLMIRLVFACIHSPQAWIQLAGCIVAATVLGSGARLVLHDFYGWLMVKIGWAEYKNK